MKITRSEFAKRMNLSLWKVGKLIRSGVVRAYTIGKGTEGKGNQGLQQFLKWPEARNDVFRPLHPKGGPAVKLADRYERRRKPRTRRRRSTLAVVVCRGCGTPHTHRRGPRCPYCGRRAAQILETEPQGDT